jgi:hypothetical protein
VVKGWNAAEFQKLYETALETGSGTEAEQAHIQEFIMTFNQNDIELQLEPRNLSSNSRFLRHLVVPILYKSQILK